MAHIDLSRNVDAILVAPASADFIAKLANGLADDLLSTLCLARDCPLLVAPAMNRQMWEHPATQRNLATLQHDGVTILGPASGAQACGEIGMGRMLEAQEIAESGARFFSTQAVARQAYAHHSGAYIRGHRRGSGNHQFKLRKNGLCNSPRSA